MSCIASTGRFGPGFPFVAGSFEQAEELAENARNQLEATGLDVQCATMWADPQSGETYAAVEIEGKGLRVLLVSTPGGSRLAGLLNPETMKAGRLPAQPKSFRRSRCRQLLTA